MSEEENKAIETIKEVASDDFDTLGDDISPKMAQNILNLIEKQQKQIETIKEENSKLIYKNVDMYYKQQQIIIKKQKEIEELKSKYKDLFFQNFDLWEKSIFPKQTIEKEYISKDKIREKIEELCKELLKYPFEDECFLRDRIEEQIDLLKELLEED